MIRLFINGLAASAGGGLTYLRNVIPELARRSDVETTVLLGPSLSSEFHQTSNVSLIDCPDSKSAVRRIVHEQRIIPALLQRAGAQVLISAGNFVLWKSAIPQILLSRNALYTSADFDRDVRRRRDYAIWADTKIKSLLARRSIRRADVTIAPSEAFARELTVWSGREVVPIHHGFSCEAFTNDPALLPPEAQALLQEGQNALRLLFVSHYNYYRNFETLFRAIPYIKKGLGGKPVKLYLTCRLDSGENPGAYKAEPASSLVSELRAGYDIVELGTIRYSSLHHLYRACQIYVTPAYAESFAHPLVEAMSSGLPVVASDIPVHREICGEAAVYFSRFSPEELARRILELHGDQQLTTRLSEFGRIRAKDFSWEEHVNRLLELSGQLIRRRDSSQAAVVSATRASRR